jgi:hypothetical protein
MLVYRLSVWKTTKLLQSFDEAKEYHKKQQELANNRMTPK